MVEVAELKCFKWELIWESVSEHDDPPALQDIDGIRSRQADIQPRSLVRQWFDQDDFGRLEIQNPTALVDAYGNPAPPIVVHDYRHSEGITLEHLFLRFRHYVDGLGLRVTLNEHKTFGKFIAPLGIKRRNQRGNPGNRQWMYRLPDVLPEHHPAAGRIRPARVFPTTPEQQKAKEDQAGHDFGIDLDAGSPF
jgi:hypothetical protein